MLIRTPNYFSEFKCIAGRCTDTCCSGWQVDVDDRSFAFYKTVGGSIGERLRSVMEEGKNGCEGSFRIREDGRCPFLNDGNLCDLYAELGEDALCETCDRYPRYSCEFGNLRETGIALSCKTAAELILRDDRTPAFTEYEDEEAFFALNNIDGELFMALMKARDKAYEIIWDRGCKIGERMVRLLKLTKRIQQSIRKPEVINCIIDGWEKSAADGADRADSADSETGASAADGGLNGRAAVRIFRRYWRYYMRQVIIKPEWPKLYEKAERELYTEEYIKTAAAFEESYRGRAYEFENILTYFVFRYFMKGVFDRDVLTKVKMCVVSTLMIMQCDMAVWRENGGRLAPDEQVEIAHIYSREVEHSEENFASLCAIFRKKRVFSTKTLQRLCAIY